jgi:hypothetical protein
VSVLAAGEFISRRYLLLDMLPSNKSRFSEIMTQFHGAVPEATDRPAILGLADSFGCVGEIGHNFFNVVQHELDSSGFTHAVINLSVSGYQPADELEMLRRFGPRYHPQVVLQAIYVGNDLEDGLSARPVSTASGLLLSESSFSLFHPGTWVFPALVWRAAYLWKNNFIRFDGGLSSGLPTYPSSHSAQSELRSFHGMLRHFRRTKDFDLAWFMAWKTIRDTIAASRSFGAHYVLVVIPDQLQIEDRAQELVFRDPSLRREDYDFQLPQKLLQELARDEGVPWIDLYPEFRESGRSGGLYIFRNPHWTEAGNRLAGKVIARGLARLEFFSRQGLRGGEREKSGKATGENKGLPDASE